MSLLALKRSAEIDWRRNVGDVLPFLANDFETESISGIVAKRAATLLKVGVNVALDVLVREVAFLNMTPYACVDCCG